MNSDYRYVLLVVSGTHRNTEQLHVVEFRHESVAQDAKAWLEGFSDKFKVKLLDDSV